MIKFNLTRKAMAKEFKIMIYCSCDDCGDYFPVEKRRKYCDVTCRERASYKRRKLKK